MKTHRHYDRAPIREALIDLSCSLESKIPVQALMAAQKQFADDYPTKKDRIEAKSEIKMGAQVGTTLTTEHVGYLFQGRQPYVFQARLDGFAVSRLQPYDTWEALEAETRRLWPAYVDAAQPARIKRLGIRYINVFEFDGGEVKLETYFRTRPHLSAGIRQKMADFFIRLELPQPKLNGMAVIIQSAAPVAADKTGVLLDIDVFKAVDLVPDDPTVWREVARLHDREYDLFEACITDAAREAIR